MELSGTQIRRGIVSAGSFVQKKKSSRRYLDQYFFHNDPLAKAFRKRTSLVDSFQQTRSRLTKRAPASSFGTEHLAKILSSAPFPDMPLKPRGIIGEGQNRYRVFFSDPLGEHREFVFTVDSDIVPVLMWEDDFEAALQGDLSPARALFDSILLLHEYDSV